MNLDAVKDFKVLLVGDAIVDEYRYVSTLGKSIKEPVLSTRLERCESFRGGIWAAAAHLADLCAQVDVMAGDKLVLNSRYVDAVYNRKLFTVHGETPRAAEPLPLVGGYDVVIVADFGHGALTLGLIGALTAKAKFLAVNAQTNSQNYGFNLITKYPRADLVVLDELEARLAAHDRDSPIETVIRALGYPRMIVTRGANGVIGYEGGEFYQEPARAHAVVDTMGAGDAALAIAAPFAAAGFAMRELVRLANAAGAVKVGIIGHREHVTRQALEEQLA